MDLNNAYLTNKIHDLDNFQYNANEHDDVEPQLNWPRSLASLNVSNKKVLTDNNLNSFPSKLDFKAMSVASLYDKNEIIEMDTQRPDTKDSSPEKLLEEDDHPPQDDDYAEDNPQTLQNPFSNNTSLSESLFFIDGIRSVDFVLAWREDVHDGKFIETHKLKREVFEENLYNEGLELEHEELQGITFVKIHAPLQVLRQYAEILKLRMPMRESLCQIQKKNETQGSLANAAQYITGKIPGLNTMKSRASRFISQFQGLWSTAAKSFLVEEKYFPVKSQRFTAVYSRDKEYLFDLTQDCFFTASIRSRIVQFILDRKRFCRENCNDYAFGIERLISDLVYIAAYPLHDGEIYVPGSVRHLLYTKWASLSKLHRYQPLDHIKDYFGVKIGLYFAWLGYYTYMLMLASFVGLACFLYSAVTLKYYKPSQDICKGDTEFHMCPLCDWWCDYWNLKETCLHSKVTYILDNTTTVFFAIFMSFWATLFLELWKRYSAEITHRWDLTGFDCHEEHPRPQYLARLKNIQRRKMNIITNTWEPEVPFWRMKLPATILSFSVVILLITLAVSAVLGVVLYRMSILAALSFYGKTVTTSNAMLFTTATAASINLILIVFFNFFYTYLAEYLTELELLRTQTEFDDSLTLKIYLLQFVNYYASIFYIAFFKGKFIGYPGKYNRFFNYRQEECGFGGCLMELCIQLSIIMVGKQIMNTILEMILPIFYKWWNSMNMRLKNKKNHSTKGRGHRWLKDLKLVEWGTRSLFPEYLEMVLQYGFVTIFVAAFPLAPFFALLNNMLEMRLDAKKLLTYHRRPVSQRVRDIGVWYRILDSIGKLSVITNGLIIAFTSDAIPKLVYRTSISKDGSLDGYLNFSLAYFNTSHFKDENRPGYTIYNNLTFCRYQDYREPPWAANAYEKTTIFWLILAARLTFVVVFENVVAIVMILVRWCIPDMKIALKDTIRREAYITNEIIIRQETMRARMENRDSQLTLQNRNGHEKTPALVKWEQILNENLSGSQLDLAIHVIDDKPTSSTSRNRSANDHDNESFLQQERMIGPVTV